ncbi:MAG TPA: HdeD family acid-resistance protein [Candidatus Saccharimonadales bacterium]|nr:HdeD family acid-resistance protein [Candidatus Saccharimonadales bacterium]
MLDVLARNWWLLAIRGVAAIVFGIGAFLWPGLTLLTLVILFAAFALVDGSSALIALLRGKPAARHHAWAVGIIGVVGILAGIGAIIYPAITALALLYVVAAWAIIIGVFGVIAAVRLRREIKGELWMAMGGIASIAFGVLLVLFPGTGLLSLVWLVGIWAVMFGMTSLALAWRLRGHHHSMTGRGAMLGAH